MATLRGAIIDSDGVVQPPFTIASTPFSGRDVVVVGSGTRFIVFWYDGAATQAAWINTTGIVESTFRVTDQTVITDAIAAGDTAVAVWDGGSFPGVGGLPNRIAIGWTTIAGDSVLGSRVTASMPAGGGFGNPYLYAPAIATDGSGYYVAWHSGRTGREDNVEGTRIAPDLTPLDVDASQASCGHAGGISIETEYALPIKTLIRVAPAGPRYFVSWTQSNPSHDLVRGRYIETNGIPSTYVSFPISLGVWPSPSYDEMDTGTATLLPSGAPVAVYTMRISGRLFVRYVGGGPRVRAVRR